MSAPGLRKSPPVIRPPLTPFLAMPMAKLICEEEGPGRHCASAMNSV